MKKSANLDLHAFTNLNDGFSDDNSSFSFASDDSGANGINDQNGTQETPIYFESIKKQCDQFSVQDFPDTKTSLLPSLDDNDYDLSSLNTPFLPQNEKQLQPVDCVFLMVASPTHFPPTDSDYLSGKPLIYMWKDLSNILSNTFSQCLQTYFKEHYSLIHPRLQFYFQIEPTVEKLNNVTTIRRDVQGGRILYHYIGFGFPRIDGSFIYSFDQNSNQFIQYSIKNLFENLKTPAWLIFDCSNASSILTALEEITSSKTNSQHKSSPHSYNSRKIDWEDWFLICATDTNEDLPIDPHIPRDFLTSCILTPVKMAVICHIIQYYRTTIVGDNFPLDQLTSPLISEDSTMHSALFQTLTAITDAIAADSLHPDVYRLLFRKDRVTMVIFQRFLLAQYLLRPFQVHPKSHPSLPDLSIHPLWHHWRTIVDMCISSRLTPQPSFATDLFVCAKESVRGFIERNEEDFISPAHLMLLFHVPETAPYRNESFLLLSQYAQTSEKARMFLSRTALFNSVFAALVSNENFDPNVFHSLCYLTICLLQTSPRFVNDIRREFEVSSFPLRLFDESLPMYTRTLVAAIISAVLPYSEGIRSVAVSQSFLISLQKLLSNSNSPLSVWALILQRRMFESFGSELKNFLNISMHIQVASFAMHSSPEVRSAALATIPCFLRPKSDISNAHLFGLVMLLAFDASFLVRFNFVLFLSKFLTIYQDEIPGNSPFGAFSHQPLRSLVGYWIDEELPFQTLISDFNQILSVVDRLCESDGFLTKFVKIGLLLVDFLVDDPHPSVSAAAVELNHFVQGLSKGKSQNLKNDEDTREGPALWESGGDAMYRVCLRQVVNAGCSLDLQTEECENQQPPLSLPVPPVSQIPSTKVVLKAKTKLDCGKPTICSYNPHSLSLAVGTVTGNVIYQCENKVYTKKRASLTLHSTSSNLTSLLSPNGASSNTGVFGSNTVNTYVYSCNNCNNENGINSSSSDDNSHKFFSRNFRSNITALSVTDWADDADLLLVGTEEGCAYVWEPQKQQQPRICFRADAPSKCEPSMPLLITPQKMNKIITARGNNGTIRMWDIRTQRIAGEWYIGGNQAATALAVSPTDPDFCVAGFLNGRIVTIDLRCSMNSGPTNIDAPKANEKILRIVGNSSKPTSFIAGTAKGSCMRWETLNNSEIIYEGRQPLADIDVHLTNPLAVLSPVNAPPFITNTNMTKLHTLKNVDHGSICSFHPVLPVIAFASPSGEIVQYELTSR